MIDKTMIDPNALQFYRMLKEAGFSAFFVGGSVRDLLLGKSPKDFDIATNATPQQIKRVIPQGRIIGRRFRHVMLEKQGGRYEIVTFRGPVVEAQEEQAELDDEALEDHPISAEAGATEEAQLETGREPRDSRDDRGRRNYPDLNQFGNAEQDAKRRDFTINALFYDPDADELVDYVEGKLDIDRRLIRSIGDSQQRMEEDPIRILRAIRHKMKLGLEYDAALEAAMRNKSPLLEQTSKDRIREEFLKVCNDHSLGNFLAESRRLGLVPHIMPWFQDLSEGEWDKGMKLWEGLKEAPVPDRASADLGLALMMVPLIGPLVLQPYKATLKESEQNYLPDMKYFLSCEPLRNFYLRNLRISRAQTDHIVRTLFYYSRMSGLWLEQGPPRRIVGRLFQHPPALLAARMARIYLTLEGKEIPQWIQELADHEGSRREGREGREGRDRDRGRDRGRGRRDRERERDEHNEESEGISAAESEASSGAGTEGENQEARGEGEGRPREEGRRDRGRGRDRERDREPREPREPKVNRLPPPDQPMIWNGPLHSPVLRPSFQEEPTIRWARKNQTVRAYRPSGIPNQPVDHAMQKIDLVYNYKPEIDASSQRGGEEQGHSEDRGERGGRGRGRERGRGRGRGRDRGERGDRGPRDEQRAARGDESQQEQGERAEEAHVSDVERHETGPEQQDRGNDRPHQDNDRPRERGDEEFDEDQIGNRLRPGEAPAPLAGARPMEYEDDEDLDDNIGNRLDAPPTSGHVGINGEGVLGRGRGGPQGGRPGGDRGRGGGGGGSGGGGGRRRGRRRGRRGGGGGGGNQPRGPSRPNHGNI